MNTSLGVPTCKECPAFALIFPFSISTPSTVAKCSVNNVPMRSNYNYSLRPTICSEGTPGLHLDGRIHDEDALLFWSGRDSRLDSRGVIVDVPPPTFWPGCGGELFGDRRRPLAVSYTHLTL